MNILNAASVIPVWISDLDAILSRRSWVPLAPSEIIITQDESSYARWSISLEAHQAELISISTSPLRLRQGLAKMLLLESETYLKNIGISHLYLEVRVSNEQATLLYKSLNWTYVTRRKAYYRDGEDADLYQKNI